AAVDVVAVAHWPLQSFAIREGTPRKRPSSNRRAPPPARTGILALARQGGVSILMNRLPISPLTETIVDRPRIETRPQLNAEGWRNMAQNGTRATGPRCIALVGPFQSGKTTLMEAILARTGAVQRQGTVEAGTTVGDGSKEARHHVMSVELSVATTAFMGESFTFVDCPGSVEFAHDMRAALPAVDAAIVVCEMDEKKVPQLQLILRELEDQKIPHFLFLNKIDKADSTIHDVLKLLQPASRLKLLLRQIPTFSGDIITGFVDLALERAFVYKEHAPSQV